MHTNTGIAEKLKELQLLSGSGFVVQLKKIVAALGAQLENVYLDDAPDDDGRYDAWS